MNEVKQKQDLVIALNKEKHNLTYELQKKLKEIKKEKIQLEKHVQVQPNANIQAEISSNYVLEK